MTARRQKPTIRGELKRLRHKTILKNRKGQIRVERVPAPHFFNRFLFKLVG